MRNLDLPLDPANMGKVEGHRETVPTARSWSRLLVPALVFAGLGYLTVWACLTAPILHLDDGYLTQRNPLANGQWPWWECFRRSWFHQYIPLTFLSYRANEFLFGLDATWSVRLVNWLIHCSSAFILWRLLLLLGVGRRGSFFVACAWVAHPLACETVAWISERSNALSFFFGVLGLWGYAKWHGAWRGVGWGAVCFSAALLSKPFSLGWLPIFFVFELLGGTRALAESGEGEPAPPPPVALRVRRSVLRLAPFVALALIFLSIGVSTYENVSRPPPGGTRVTAVCTATGIFLRYAWNIIAPVKLSAMYATNAIVSLADVRLWLNLVIWAVVVGASVGLASSRRRAIFGWLWFFGGLGPGSNLIPIAYPMQDRFVYIASAGLLVVLVEVASGIAARIRQRGWMPERRLGLYGIVLSVIYVGFLGALTALRSPYWSDSGLLMAQAVEHEPDGVLPHFHYAIQLQHRASLLERSNPEVARDVREAAIQHLRLAAEQRDAYIGGSIYLHTRLARNLQLVGKENEALQVLAQCQKQADALSAETLAGRPPLIPTAPGAASYVVPDAEIAEVHMALGEAYLALAANRAGRPSRVFYAKAVHNAQRASNFDSLHRDQYALMAKVFLFGEAAGDGSPGRIEVARGQLAEVTGQFEKMWREREALPAFSRPITSERVKALACVAMARAALDVVRERGGGSLDEAALGVLQSSIHWARRAVSIDPRLGEAYWTLALACDLSARAQSATAPAQAEADRKECRDALSAIPSNSPRVPQARAMLTQRRKGREERPD